MRLFAQAVILSLIPAGKIMVIRVVVGVLVIEVDSAVRAFEESHEHILFNVLWFAVFYITESFLNPFPHIAFNDWLMDAFVYFPLVFRIIQPVLYLIGNAVCPKVDDVIMI